MLNVRSTVCIASLLISFSCYAQSIDMVQLRHSGLPNPQVNVTNSTSPNISTISSFLQNLPPASPPASWPFGGYQLFNDGVSGFPQEVDVDRGLIRIFVNGAFLYFQDANGLESFLSSVFLPLFGSVALPVGSQPSSTPVMSSTPAIAADPLPLSGGEPPFNPAPWNDHDGVQGGNNCYNYGVNKMTGTFAQPGRKGGRPITAVACNNVLASAIVDGLIPWVAGVACPADKFKVALVVDPGVDYHWYRQDSNGNWSHKLASGEAMNTEGANTSNNPITDPRTANRNIRPAGDPLGALNYVNFCAFMCVRSDPAAVNIAIVLPAYTREAFSCQY